MPSQKGKFPTKRAFVAWLRKRNTIKRGNCPLQEFIGGGERAWVGFNTWGRQVSEKNREVGELPKWARDFVNAVNNKEPFSGIATSVCLKLLVPKRRKAK